jgi:hypothetical protein
MRDTTDRRLLVWLILLGLVLSPAVWAAKNGQQAKPRVKPKKFTPEETARVFFDDVFAVVVGSRPDLNRPASSGPATVAGNDSEPSTVAENSASPSNVVDSSGWSQVISAATIESEIKSLKLLLDQDVTTPGDFKGRGYKACRTHFSVAAMLFAVINEYGGEVRWKADAATARDLFARSAANAKVGTTQVFNEARQRKTDLDDLLNGNSPADRASDPQNNWPTICDRQPLMQRLDAAFEGQLRKHSASKSEFAANKERIVHEAEIIAMIAEVLNKDGMEDFGDETYMDFAKDLKDQARAAVEGVREDDYEKVRAAVGNLDQTCNACHDSYRA